MIDESDKARGLAFGNSNGKPITLMEKRLYECFFSMEIECMSILF